MTETPFDPALRRRNRIMLVALFALFLGTFALAGALRFSGWRPDGLRNKGELLQPALDLRTTPVLLAGGQAYAWHPEQRHWRILVVAPEPCDAACSRLGEQLDVVWQLFGKDADRVEVLWLGTPPDTARTIATLTPIQRTPQLLQQLPSGTDAATYVIDPNGFAMLRYASGFDPADLRSDMARLLKLR